MTAAQDARAALAFAASTVAGVSVQPYYGDATKPGSGYVERARTDYPNRFGGVVTWTVVVVLAVDVAAAEQWVDANQLALVGALAQEMTVTAARYERLALDNGSTLPALFIDGTREEE
jgi:hypothetical protein